MPRPLRAARIAKLALTLATVLLLSVWIASRWLRVEWVGRGVVNPNRMWIAGGCFTYDVWNLRAAAFRGGGFWMTQHSWAFRWSGWGTSTLGVTRNYFRVVPLWPVCAGALAATIGVWWWEGRPARRVRAGLCGRCGYSRAGLANGAACPECGVQG